MAPKVAQKVQMAQVTHIVNYQIAKKRYENAWSRVATRYLTNGKKRPHLFPTSPLFRSHLFSCAELQAWKRHTRGST